MQAKVSRFPVNPDVFRILLEKMRLFKQQKMENHLKQTAVQNSQECVSKTNVVIYFISLYLKLGEKHVLKIRYTFCMQNFSVNSKCGIPSLHSYYMLCTLLQNLILLCCCCCICHLGALKCSVVYWNWNDAVEIGLLENVPYFRDLHLICTLPFISHEKSLLFQGKNQDLRL